MIKEDACILILRFSSLGDVVMATSAARYLRQARPKARILFATKAAFAPLLKGHPDLDEVLILGPQGLGALAGQARDQNVDAVLDLHSNLRSRMLAWRLEKPVARWQHAGLNRRLRVSLPFLAQADLPPVIQRYVSAAAFLIGEPPPAGPLPRLAIDGEAVAWAQDWLKAQGWEEGQKLLAVAPGAAWPTKRWGVEHLAQTLALVSEFDRVRFVLVGSQAEAPLGQSVKAVMKKGGENVFNACDQTSDIRRLAALIGLSQGFLGHDSGPMHVAEALGVPICALFGPTVKAFGFYPQGSQDRVFEQDLACRPCSVHGSERCPLGHHECMEKTEPFLVAQHLRRQLGLEAV